MNNSIAENERKILTLLTREGSLSKRELAEKGSMGWATVVKMINRLQDRGFVKINGTQNREYHEGKNAYIYSLVEYKPIAIGIDVEYTTTTIIITNLKGDILLKREYSTPNNLQYSSFCKFLESKIREVVSDFVDNSCISGIGIGMPNILFLSKSRHSYKDIQEKLSSSLGYEVFVENNVRAYTLFQKWRGYAYHWRNFITVTIRTGLGSGIYLNGDIFNGLQGEAGEIGHLKLENKRRKCRCGGYGCLEAYVNIFSIYKMYEKITGRSSHNVKDLSRKEVVKGVEELFQLADKGDKRAVIAVKTIADYLSRALASVILILNISNIIVSGDFGERGEVIVPFLKEYVKKHVLLSSKFNIVYSTLNNLDFARGSALLVLRKYLLEVA